MNKLKELLFSNKTPALIISIFLIVLIPFAGHTWHANALKKSFNNLEITLTHSNVERALNQEFHAESYIAIQKGELIIDHDVNINTPGIYEVVYTVMDNYNQKKQATLTVDIIKTDITPPELILTNNQIIIFEAVDFTSFIQSVSDNIDALTINDVIIDTTNFNIDLPGTYSIIYFIQDSSNNETRQELTVIVQARNQEENNNETEQNDPVDESNSEQENDENSDEIDNNENSVDDNQDNDSSNTNVTDYYTDFSLLINDLRTNLGLSNLQLDDALNNAAFIRVKEMYDNNYFDHIRPDGSSVWSVLDHMIYTYSAENISLGHQTANAVFIEWLNSEGHYNNMINPSITKFGISYYHGYWCLILIG